MYPQIACSRRCIITLVAFVWFFSPVRFQMFPQIASPRGCKITLVTFVWFFSSVYFQMYPYSTYMTNFCRSHRSLYIGTSFTPITIFKILIHNSKERSDDQGKGWMQDLGTADVPWILFLSSLMLWKRKMKVKYIYASRKWQFVVIICFWSNLPKQSCWDLLCSTTSHPGYLVFQSRCLVFFCYIQYSKYMLLCWRISGVPYTKGSIYCV